MGDMSRREAIKLLKGGVIGVNKWQRWRRDFRRSRKVPPSLKGASFKGVTLFHADLSGLDLEGADFEGAILVKNDFSGARLEGARFVDASVGFVLFAGARLRQANFRDARLMNVQFIFANLGEADFAGATLEGGVFGKVDLSRVKKLESVLHSGPSTIGTDTLEKSRGRIPEAFLAGCGFKAWQIAETRLYDPDLDAQEVIDLQYKAFEARMTRPLILGGVFISYSRADVRFAVKLRKKLMAKGVYAWLDCEDGVAGPLQQQIDRAIGVNNVVLLVLSEDAVGSDWVEHEMKTARRIEREEGRDVLCPVAIDDAWKQKTDDVKWEHLTDKNILDFSKWRTKAFDGQFKKLLKGLNIYYARDGEHGYSGC